MFELTIDTHFSAAHRLREYGGDCERLHGHNWKVRVTIARESLDTQGMVIDFRDLKAIVRDVLKTFDHAFLNEIDAFKTINPTTENIARLIGEGVERRLPPGARVAAATAWETPGCSATWRPAARS